MKKTLTNEVDVPLPASEVWEVYSTLRLIQLIPELVPHIISKIEVVEGNGDVGTVISVSFPPESPGPGPYKEKFVKIDHDRRLKEVVAVEGGYFEIGFVSYLIRFENIEKTADSSIIKSTIEYEIGEEHAAKASFVSTDYLASIGEAISKYLLQKKTEG